MSVEVNPVGLHCGRSCLYCYELPTRQGERNRRPGPVDHARVQLRVLEAAGPDGFTLFGGEPLLASLEDLEKLWAFGLERYGKNGCQTDGHVIGEEHLALFKRYKVHVGFSIDGPGELNGARVAGTPEQTLEATNRSIAALRRCLAEGIGASLIVTLHRLNADGDRLPRLLTWLRDLAGAGLRSVRLHSLELDAGARHVALDLEQALAAFRACRAVAREAGLQLDIFTDMEKKLRDPEASATCIWNDCDPWTTPAVHGIGPDGSRSLCQRVHKDGRQWAPMPGAPARIRQAVLWATPQERGGCAGCRFFLACGGQCPGTAIGGDWRRRSSDCALWFALLSDVEAELVARGEQPASLAPDLGERVARRLAWYAAGAAGGHGDAHGDAPHGDGHGDHSDHGDHADLAPVVAQLAGGEVIG